jgi:molybdenum-dependent DNA-binding transcriptional regulator ModE
MKTKDARLLIEDSDYLDKLSQSAMEHGRWGIADGLSAVTKRLRKLAKRYDKLFDNTERLLQLCESWIDVELGGTKHPKRKHEELEPFYQLLAQLRKEK